MIHQSQCIFGPFDLNMCLWHYFGAILKRLHDICIVLIAVASSCVGDCAKMQICVESGLGYCFTMYSILISGDILHAVQSVMAVWILTVL